MGCRSLTLSGGEPLVIGEKLFRYAEYAKNKNMEVTLTTNGVLVDKFRTNHFDIFDKIQVSLDGPKKIHDYIRGSGTFEHVIKSIHSLSNHSHLIVMTTLSSLNVDKLKTIYELTKEIGVRMCIERITCVGRGSEMKRLTKEQFRRALSICRRLDIHTTDPLFFRFKQQPKIQKNKITGGCSAGVAAIAITASLDVLPCVRIRNSIGNLKKDNIEKIWYESDVLNRLRNRNNLKGKCGICKYKNICGGCRADALSVYGDMFYEDSLCWIN
jgi:radical SAM protein with 4Fe4S-binding SPASM domain